jgi:hypothetical protein
MKNHPIVQQKIDYLVRGTAEDVYSLQQVNDQALRLGFWLALTYAESITTIQDWLFDRDPDTRESIKRPVDRWHTYLSIDARHKPALLATMLDTIDHTHSPTGFITTYVINTGTALTGRQNQLVERCTLQWDIILNEYGGVGACNKLVLEFHRPAIVGEQLSPTCTVGWHSTARTDRYLAITCSKPAD